MAVIRNLFLDYLIYTIGKGKLDKMSLVTKNLNLNSEPARDVTSVCPLLLGCPQIRSGGGSYGIAWHDWVWFTMFYSPLLLRMNSWFHLIDDDALHWAPGVISRYLSRCWAHIHRKARSQEAPGSSRKLQETPRSSWKLLDAPALRAKQKRCSDSNNICFFRCQLRGGRWGVFQ